jgi:hypothetical protein
MPVKKLDPGLGFLALDIRAKAQWLRAYLRPFSEKSPQV